MFYYRSCSLLIPVVCLNAAPMYSMSLLNITKIGAVWLVLDTILIIENTRFTSIKSWAEQLL